MNYLNFGKRSKLPRRIFRKTAVFWVFLFVFLLFLCIQLFSPNLVGNDSYFYIKFAKLMRTHEGLLHQFPWLYYTTYHQHFKGLHFLSAVLYIPFTYFGNLIIGAKVATAFFFALAMAIFSFLLQKLKLKHVWFWALLLMASSSIFIFRMNLSRPISISLAFLLLGTYALIKQKTWLLFLVSFFYVWAYDGYLMILVLALIYFLAQLFTSRRGNIELFFVTLFGVLLGKVLNPYFPYNIIKEHSLEANPIFKFLVVPPSLEWIPPSFNKTFLSNPLTITAFVLLVVYFLFWRAYFYNNALKKDKLLINFLFTANLFFFGIASISIRFFEYWPPFLILCVAYLFEKYFLRQIKAISKKSTEEIINVWPKKVRPVILKIFLLLKYCISPHGVKKGLIFFTIVLLGFLAYHIFTLKKLLDTNPSHLRYWRVAAWLRKNTPQGAIVFNVNWDNFPRLFFVNTHNYYILGLDALYLYQYNQKLYWTWWSINRGRPLCFEREDCLAKQYCSLSVDKEIYQEVKNSFHSKYIFIDQLLGGKKDRNQELVNILNTSPYFKKVFQDSNYPAILLFQLK